MRIIVAQAAFLATSIALIGSVSAQSSAKSFECRSTQPNVAAVTISCQVANGSIVETSCSCPMNFVLIDTDVAPAAGLVPAPGPRVASPG